jgi:lysophospholipase L1-like esterase
VHIGANDVSKYLNRSEELVSKIHKMLSELSEKRKNFIVSGIVPRPLMGGYWHSRALSLDTRIQCMCKQLGGVFIDNWTAFYGRKGNHISDGVHLNVSGIALLENNFAAALKQLKN